MRVYFYISILSFLMACNSGGYESKSYKVADTADEESMPVMESNFDQGFDYEYLAEQKLQELADLQMLRVNHPEFQNDLREQVLKLGDTLEIQGFGETVKVDILKQLSQGNVQSDSSSYSEYAISLSTPDTTVRDTIYVLFKTRDIQIDGETTTAVQPLIYRELPE